jgi:endonuclease YncB( thermonuclease family)
MSNTPHETPPDEPRIEPPAADAAATPFARAAAHWRRIEDAVDDWIEHRLRAAPVSSALDRIEAQVERAAQMVARVPWRRPPPLAIGAVVGVAALAVLVVATGVGRRGDGGTRPAATETPSASRTTAAPTSVETQIAAQRLARFADGVEPPGDRVTTQFEEPMRLSPPFDAIDSVVFDAEMRRFRLWGVWPVGRNEICRGEDGGRFACGLMARAALQNHIARRKPVCIRMFGAARPSDFVEVTCTVDGDDLALHMVRSGFAFPAPRAGTLLRAAAVEAMAEKRGYWAGPQIAPTADRAEEDARSIPVGGTRVLTAPADTTVPFAAPTQDETPRVRIR